MLDPMKDRPVLTFAMLQEVADRIDQIRGEAPCGSFNNPHEGPTDGLGLGEKCSKCGEELWDMVDAQHVSYPEPPWYLEDPDLWDGLGSMHEFLERERLGLEQ